MLGGTLSTTVHVGPLPRCLDGVIHALLPAFLRNDLLEISRWAAETRPCGPDALKDLIEDLHREVLRIIEVRPFVLKLFPGINVLLKYDKMCNRFSEMEKQRCVMAKNN